MSNMEYINKFKSFFVNELTQFLNSRPDLVLLGDSNTLISYFGLFSNKKWSSLVANELKMSVANFGRDGATTFEILNSNRFKRAVKLNAEYYLICFGLNDEKYRSVTQFQDDTLKMVDSILSKTNGKPILMTNLKVDFEGGHYKYDRNAQKIMPYDNVKRKIARELNIPLIDIYQRFDKEIKKGMWDFQIRNTNVLDDSLDTFHVNDPNWFSNIHYNEKGNKLVADEVVKYFRRHILEKTS